MASGDGGITMFDGASSTAYSFRREAFSDVIGEARPWFNAQWEEGGEARDVMPLAPAMSRYLASEKAGILRTYIVRYHGEYVGYAAYFVFFGMHSEAVKGAISDAVWIRKEHRRPGIAMRLMTFVEAELRAEGVIAMHTQSSEDRPGLRRLLERMGHPVVAHTHAKVLNHA